MPRKKKRKPLKRNHYNQLVNPIDICNYVEKMIDKYVEDFPDVDGNDLYLILVKEASSITARANFEN